MQNPNQMKNILTFGSIFFPLVEKVKLGSFALGRSGYQKCTTFIFGLMQLEGVQMTHPGVDKTPALDLTLFGPPQDFVTICQPVSS